MQTESTDNIETENTEINGIEYIYEDDENDPLPLKYLVNFDIFDLFCYDYVVDPTKKYKLKKIEFTRIKGYIEDKKYPASYFAYKLIRMLSDEKSSRWRVEEKLKAIKSISANLQCFYLRITQQHRVNFSSTDENSHGSKYNIALNYFKILKILLDIVVYETSDKEQEYIELVQNLHAINQFFTQENLLSIFTDEDHSTFKSFSEINVIIEDQNLLYLHDIFKYTAKLVRNLVKAFPGRLVKCGYYDSVLNNHSNTLTTSGPEVTGNNVSKNSSEGLKVCRKQMEDNGQIQNSGVSSTESETQAERQVVVSVRTRKSPINRKKSNLTDNISDDGTKDTADGDSSYEASGNNSNASVSSVVKQLEECVELASKSDPLPSTIKKANAALPHCQKQHIDRRKKVVRQLHWDSSPEELPHHDGDQPAKQNNSSNKGEERQFSNLEMEHELSLNSVENNNDIKAHQRKRLKASDYNELKFGKKRCRFTESEKEAIKEGARIYQPGNWSLIKARFSEVLQDRSTVQIKDAYRTMKKKGEIM